MVLLSAQSLVTDKQPLTLYTLQEAGQVTVGHIGDMKVSCYNGPVVPSTFLSSSQPEEILPREP